MMKESSSKCDVVIILYYTASIMYHLRDIVRYLSMLGDP